MRQNIERGLYDNLLVQPPYSAVQNYVTICVSFPARRESRRVLRKSRGASSRISEAAFFVEKLLTARPVLIKTNWGILARIHKKPHDKMYIFSGGASFYGFFFFFCYCFSHSLRASSPLVSLSREFT